MNRQETKTHRNIDWAVVCLLMLGAALRLIQYLAKSSLWGDELAIVDGIYARSPLSLLTQPTEGQMTPTGFLLILKTLSSLFGFNEYTLRFIPLASSLFALFLFERFCDKVLPRGAFLLALGAFATSPPMIRYAAQVKPYSSDVAISLVSVIAARNWLAHPTRRNRACLAFVGALAIWLSYPVVFILVGIGLTCVTQPRQQPSTSVGRQALPIFLVWTASAGLVGILELHRFSKGTHAFMMDFWADWMLPRDKNLQAISAYLLRINRDFFSYFLHLPKWPVFLALFVLGLWYVCKHTKFAWLVVFPILIALFASMLDLYPFAGRLVLFLVPNVYVLIAAGIEALACSAPAFRNHPNWRTPIFLASAFVFCLWPLRKAHPIFHNSETRPMIAYLGRHYSPSDVIYVHDMAWRAFGFYGADFGLRQENATKTTEQSVLGPKPFIVLKDLENFRGRPRVWILFASGYRVEQSCPVLYLDTIGKRLDYQSSIDASL